MKQKVDLIFFFFKSKLLDVFNLLNQCIVENTFKNLGFDKSEN